MDKNLLKSKIPNIKENEPLSKYTQIKIGGPAEMLVLVKTKKEFENTIRIAHEAQIPITILGWGSNILVSDNGLKGLVIINKTSEMTVHTKDEGDQAIEITEETEEVLARLDQLQPDIYGKFDDLNYDETNLPTSIVTMDSGVNLPLAILKTIKADLTGLQWYAGIPGTIGGAVYNNIHGGTHFFHEIVESVEVLDKNTLEKKILQKKNLGVEYDESIFHRTNDYILSVDLKLFHGDSEKALKVMQTWRLRKKIQPWISAGCVWMNLDSQKKDELGLPSSGIGYMVDKELGLKGLRQGDAMISDQHAAFIENKGKAKASDVLFLMKEIHKAAKNKFGVELKPEIFLLGFDDDEIREFKR
jgi:UDP-N-acetylmuramate dehydrogenase